MQKKSSLTFFPLSRFLNTNESRKSAKRYSNKSKSPPKLQKSAKSKDFDLSKSGHKTIFQNKTHSGPNVTKSKTSENGDEKSKKSLEEN